MITKLDRDEDFFKDLYEEKEEEFKLQLEKLVDDYYQYETYSK